MLSKHCFEEILMPANTIAPPPQPRRRDHQKTAIRFIGARNAGASLRNSSTRRCLACGQQLLYIGLGRT
jgi:hypothetical protein